MKTYRPKPWHTVNDTPFSVGDRVTVEFINHDTGEPYPSGQPEGVFTIEVDNGILGIRDFGDPEAWFHREFIPLSAFSPDVRFTLVE